MKKPARSSATAPERASVMAVPPLEIDAARRPPLGMPPAAFLRDYWQKRPLLIRNAFPGFVSPIEPGDLAGLACEEGALSRLISHDRARDAWLVRHGPFDEAEFPGMPARDWTLLVQDVDKWDADVASVLDAFAFLPRWRIDDVMVSFAAPGGSVGAHVDQYDVFLLQAEGHRRWQIDASPNPSLAFRDDVDLRLLSEFNATHDWVLAPGDMLYLPPGVPHHGVAEDACLTFSIGMRAPSAAELLGDFVDTLASEADEALRYRDPDLAVPRDPAEIDAATMGRVVEALNVLRMNDPDRLGDWFGRFITVYRSAGMVAADDTQDDANDVEVQLRQGAVLARHPFSRMAWRRASRGATLYVSGQAVSLPVADARRLANVTLIDGDDYDALSPRGRESLRHLARQGHYRVVNDNDAMEGDA